MKISTLFTCFFMFDLWQQHDRPLLGVSDSPQVAAWSCRSTFSAAAKVRVKSRRLVVFFQCEVWRGCKMNQPILYKFYWCQNIMKWILVVILWNMFDNLWYNCCSNKLWSTSVKRRLQIPKWSLWKPISCISHVVTCIMTLWYLVHYCYIRL